MNIFCSEIFEEELKKLLERYAKDDLKATQSFKIYLDTIIINMPTKYKKYKKSIYFDDENIRDIQHQGLTIPFFFDEDKNSFLLLNIIEK